MPYAWLLVFFLLPVSRRRQDQRLRDGDDDDQGHRHLEGRRARHQRQARQLPAAGAGRPLPAHLRLEPALRGGDDAALPGDRLPVRLLHGARAPLAPAGPADARDAAVLDLVPAARLRLEGAPDRAGPRAERDRGDRPRPAARRARPDSRAGAADEHAVLARPRHDLHLPAVHDPAALLEPRQDGPAPARGRRRSRRERLDRVLAGHRAALARRHHRRLDAGLHPVRRRVRHPRAARRPADADDRPHALGRVLQQQRLADGVRRRGDDGAAGDRSARRLQPLPGRGRASARPDDMRSAPPLNRSFAPQPGSRSATPSCTCRSSPSSSTRSTTRRSPTSGAASRCAGTRRSPTTASCSPASRCRSRSRSRPPARRSSSARSPRSRSSAIGASSAARSSPAWSPRRSSCPR